MFFYCTYMWKSIYHHYCIIHGYTTERSFTPIISAVACWLSVLVENYRSKYSCDRLSNKSRIFETLQQKTILDIVRCILKTSFPRISNLIYFIDTTLTYVHNFQRRTKLNSSFKTKTKTNIYIETIFYYFCLD